MSDSARGVAFYLPQFHAIEENDHWWEPGFTEWTMVRQAVPRFPGHLQPNRPGTLGYYSLTDASVLAAQGELALAYGLDGFAVWHYWFGAGRTLLDVPIRTVLQDPAIEFPYCLAWANESWTRAWYGRSSEVLIAQDYLGQDDDARHFANLEPHFHDVRYLTVNNEPIFIVYRPLSHPQLQQWINQMREHAQASGLVGLHLVGYARDRHEIRAALSAGLDAVIPVQLLPREGPAGLWYRLLRRYARPTRVDYGKIMNPSYIEDVRVDPRVYPCVTPNWDNTPRYGDQGLVVTGAEPDRFGAVVSRARAALGDRPQQNRLLFVKSWNEWAEGNYLEPDDRYGMEWLKAWRYGNSGS